MVASLLFRLCLGAVLATAIARADESQWSSRDYVDLYFRHYNGHVPLPHLREEAQKVLFNHLVDPSNITRIEVAPISDDEKLRQLQIILSVLGSYRAAYNVAVIVGEPLVAELTEVQAYSLQVAGAVANLSQKSSQDNGASSAWATQVEGVIEEAGNTERYSPEQIATMANAVAKYYPAIAAALPEDERRRLRAQALKLDEAGNVALKQMKRVLLAAP